ncbi:pyridoxamine 5'-phosphate oxidase family protein [Candidatus Saccharibacteria bacterium]|nr:pyridoxamine 5'-phosphate oxidase family protein [Candidatus Saccharibacteria bacterium]
MEKILEMLQGVFYIATEDGDQPRVRPFDGAALIDNKIYIETLAKKNVSRQLLQNPKCEIYTMGDFGSVRLSATARLVDGEEKDQAIPAIGKYHEGELDGIAIFALENILAVVSDRNGEISEITT